MRSVGAQKNTRYSSLKPPSDVTLDWIWKEGSQHNAKQKSKAAKSPRLVEWLHSADEVVFFLTGKPGSGKSSLMKHLVDSKKTKKHLASCFPGRWLFAKFFFYELGGEVHETTFEGCVRGLIHQLIVNKKGLVSVLEDWNESVWDADSEDVLTQGELEKAMELIATQKEVEGNICVFVDGLDECEDCRTSRGSPLDFLLEWIRRAGAGKSRMGESRNLVLSECIV